VGPCGHFFEAEEYEMVSLGSQNANIYQHIHCIGHAWQA
jgi:hypothetical protein